jgi:hypothetical protein
MIFVAISEESNDVVSLFLDVDGIPNMESLHSLGDFIEGIIISQLSHNILTKF